MITVFALFEEPAKLGGALEALRRQKVLGGGYRVLTTQPARQTRLEMKAWAARLGNLNPAPGPSPARVLGGSTVLAELEALGLSPGESRFFADSMRQGAHTLVLRSVGSEHDPSNLLRQIGAIHVVAVRE